MKNPMKKLALILIAFITTSFTVNGQYYPYNSMPNGSPYQPYSPYPNYPMQQSYPFNPYNQNYQNYPNNYPMNPNFQVYQNNGYCTPLAPPANGMMASSCGNTYGSSCTFTCFSGYSLRGSATVTCMGSNWSANPPTCVSSGSAVNGNIIGYWAVPNRRG